MIREEASTIPHASNGYRNVPSRNEEAPFPCTIRIFSFARVADRDDRPRRRPGKPFPPKRFSPTISPHSRTSPIENLLTQQAPPVGLFWLHEKVSAWLSAQISRGDLRFVGLLLGGGSVVEVDGRDDLVGEVLESAEAVCYRNPPARVSISA
jgi:hypothetical protein